MKSLDTNVILRFLLRDVPEQADRAKSLISTSECYVTDVVLTETVFVLEKVYEAPRDQIAFSLKSFIALQFVTSNSALFSDVFDLYETQPTLSIIDCYAALEASVWENDLITFDKKLLKHGGRQVREP